jgi:putative zinc finger/helix-turn-helix YgiT family protein
MNDSEIKPSETCCPACTSGNVQAQIVNTSFPYGEGESAVTLSVSLQAFQCRDCGLEYVDDSAEDLKHKAVCRHLGVFTPAEIESIRDSLGMSRSKFAHLTKIGEATLGRWERGALVQNAAYDQFLYLLTFPENVLRLLNREQLQNAEKPKITQSTEAVQKKFRGLGKTARLDAVMKKAANFRLYDPEAA